MTPVDAIMILMACGALAGLICAVVEGYAAWMRYREREARRVRDANLARWNVVPFKGTRKWHQ